MRWVRVEANRKLLADILRRDGYDVLLAKDGEEAADRFANEHVDLALLDVKMSRRSGFEVCRLIKSNPETRLVPVILVTGLINTIDQHCWNLNVAPTTICSNPFGMRRN